MTNAAVDKALAEMEDKVADDKRQGSVVLVRRNGIANGTVFSFRRLRRKMGMKLLFRYRWEVAKGVLLSLDTVFLVLAFICLFSDVCVAGLLSFRGVLRPLFVVCYYRRLRNAFTNIFKTIPDFFDILFLLVIVLV